MTIRVLVADDQALVRGSFRILVDTAPDLTSVGVNVLSSVACTNGASCGGEGDWAFFSGTSMKGVSSAKSAIAAMRSRS